MPNFYMRQAPPEVTFKLRWYQDKLRGGNVFEIPMRLQGQIAMALERFMMAVELHNQREEQMLNILNRIEAVLTRVEAIAPLLKELLELFKATSGGTPPAGTQTPDSSGAQK